MKRSLACLLTVAALVTGCTDPDPRSASFTDDSAATCDPRWDAALRKWSRAGFSGSVAISTAGELDCVGGYGLADRRTGRPNTAETVFAIGSVSKAFTAAAVLGMVDAGRLRLVDRAGEVIPALDGPASRATIRQLLSHTSGLSGSIGADHEPLGRTAAIRRIGRLDRAYAPGRRYLYSNAGYTLLALIVDTASGSEYRTYLTSHVVRTADGIGSRGFWDGDPAAAGPRAVGYLDGGRTHQMGSFAGPHWALAGNGDLAMSMPDLASWTYALFDGDLLSAQSTQLITRPGADRQGGAAATPGWVRYDASVYGQPVIATSGGGGDIGHNTVVAWLPKTEQVVAIGSNTQGVRAEDLLAKLAPAFVSGAEIPLPPNRTRVDPKALAEVAGSYQTTGGGFDVEATEDGLRVAAHGTTALEALFPPPDALGGDVERHQERVLAMLSGQTSDGEAERAAIESDFGPITAVDPIATVVVDGELQTYIEVTTEDEAFDAWYAVDTAGQIAAAEAPAETPTLVLVPAGRRRFVPDSPVGTGPDVSVTFGHRRMVVTGPDDSVNARLDR